MIIKLVLILVVFCLSGTGSRGQQMPRLPSPQTLSPAPLRKARGVPMPAESIVALTCPGPSPWPHPGGTCLRGEVFKGALSAQPPAEEAQETEIVSFLCFKC
ncbi:hypothetical protein ILYODFUR_022477 [Ilyodon furcidens]|uniref:Secreted protein n=1 Tax=Ilyodon furcidens TaxID=33524 RepID=A0ABV0UU88_9TELE